MKMEEGNVRFFEFFLPFFFFNEEPGKAQVIFPKLQEEFAE